MAPVASGPGLSQPQLRAWRLLVEMQELLRGRIEQQLQADSGLSNADYTVLVVLSEAPDGQLRALHLVRALEWEKSRLHHQLTRMCGRGLIERRSGAGRTSYAAITAAGRAALEAAVPSHSAEVRRLVFDSLTDLQVQQLAEISQSLLDGLRGDVTS